MEPAEMNTSDPQIKIADDLSYLVLDLRNIQAKLHRRLTQNVKRRQEEYILGETAKIFGAEREPPETV